MAVPVIPKNYKKNEKLPWSFTADDGNQILAFGGWGAYASIHSYYDDKAVKGESGFPENKGAYKLPTFKLEGTDITLYRSGVLAAGARIQGAGNRPDIPESEMGQVRARLKKLYTEFDMVPPWEKKKSVLLDEINKTLGLPTEAPSDEVSNELNLLNDELLIGLKKSIENMEDDNDLPEPSFTDGKTVTAKSGEEYAEYYLSFDVLKKSPDTLSQKQALNKPAVKKFLATRGDFKPDDLVLVHGNPSSARKDIERDEVDPEGFIEALAIYKKSASGGVLLRQHDFDKPVGHILHYELVKNKPYVIGYVDEPETVKDIRDGKIGGFSFYAVVLKSFIDYEKGTKRVTKLKIQEVSVVTIPTNEDAQLSILKSGNNRLRINGIEDGFSEQQEKELSKGILATIKTVLGIATKPEPNHGKIIKSLSLKINQMKTLTDELENSEWLKKAGRKMKGSRLQIFESRLNTIKKEVVGLEELLKELRHDEPEKNDLEKSRKSEVKRKMETNEIKAIVNQALNEILGSSLEKALSPISERISAIEKATGIDEVSALKKSINDEVEALVKSKLEKLKEAEKEVIDQLDERMKVLEKSPSISRVGEKKETGNKKPKPYSEMTPEEKEEFWSNSV